MLLAHHSLRTCHGHVVVLIAIVCAGCTTVVAPTQQGAATESSQRCVPAMTKRARVEWRMDEARAESAMLASSRFSADALRVAELIGVLPVLNEIAALEAALKRSDWIC